MRDLRSAMLLKMLVFLLLMVILWFHYFLSRPIHYIKINLFFFFFFINSRPITSCIAQEIISALKMFSEIENL